MGGEDELNAAATHDGDGRTDDDTRITSRERDELLTFYDRNLGVPKGRLFLGLLLFFSVILVFVPKVYISNKIYYLSRDISKLDNKKTLLVEERRRLLKSLEDIKAKYLLEPVGG